jgi:methylphosphotriester-DNA--protein-cysteine methyltransferase
VALTPKPGWSTSNRASNLRYCARDAAESLWWDAVAALDPRALSGARDAGLVSSVVYGADRSRVRSYIDIGARRGKGMSPVLIARRFRAYAGCSITTYVRRHKVRAAASMLSSTPTSIGMVSAQYGFYDQPHLSVRQNRSTKMLSRQQPRPSMLIWIP